MSACKVDECERPIHLKRDQLCNAHYLQQRKGLDFHPTRNTVPTGAATCSYVQCDRPVNSRGWCASHYRQWWEGKALAPLYHRGFSRNSAAIRDTADRKRCSRCNEWKPEDAYASDAKRMDGLQGQCRSCMSEVYQATELRERRYRHLKKYNLTPEQVELMLEAQGGGCAICGTTDSGERYWAVDHNHACCPGAGSCGKCVRGMLCGNCNIALGLVRDNPDVLRSMIRYLG